MDNHPKVQLSSIGKSHENRAIYAVSMGDSKNPKIVVDCGIHAREWVRLEFVDFDLWFTNLILKKMPKTLEVYFKLKICFLSYNFSRMKNYTVKILKSGKIFSWFSFANSSPYCDMWLSCLSRATTPHPPRFSKSTRYFYTKISVRLLIRPN